MGSSRLSSASLAGKVRSCFGGKRMTFTQFVLTAGGWGGVECDLKSRCIECTGVDDSQMKDYVSRKLGLQRRLLAKRKHKTSSQTSKVIVEPKVFDRDTPPAVTAPSLCYWLGLTCTALCSCKREV